MQNDNTNRISLNLGLDAMPQAMLEDMMAGTMNLAKSFSLRFRDLGTTAQQFRDALLSKDLIKEDTMFADSPIPTCCGVDGSYKKEVMLSGDIVGVCGVAVEGLSPPKEEKRWDAPRHIMFLEGEPHSNELEILIECLMFAYELELASGAPHGLVLLDFGMSSPLVEMVKVVGRLGARGELKIANELEERFERFVANYLSVLESGANGLEKVFVGVPKSTTSREVFEEIIGQMPNENIALLGNERAALSLILKPGEFTKPVKIRSNFMLGADRSRSGRNKHVIKKFLETRVSYYKPNGLLPAFRLELPEAVSKSRQLFGSVIQGIKHQAQAPGILEPWPLYLADRMARSMNASIPFVSNAISRFALDSDDGNFENLLTMLMHHRTRRIGK